MRPRRAPVPLPEVIRSVPQSPTDTAEALQGGMKRVRDLSGIDLGQRHFQGHVQSLVCVCHRSQGTGVVGKEVSEQLVCQPALSSEALWGTSKKGCPSETLVQGPLLTTCTLHKTEALSAAPLSHSCLTVPVLLSLYLWL